MTYMQLPFICLQNTILSLKCSRGLVGVQRHLKEGLEGCPNSSLSRSLEASFELVLPPCGPFQTAETQLRLRADMPVAARGKEPVYGTVEHSVSVFRKGKKESCVGSVRLGVSDLFLLVYPLGALENLNDSWCTWRSTVE